MRPAKPLIAATLLLAATALHAADPDCTNPTKAPAATAATQLKAAGVLNAEDADPARSSVTRIASEKIGDDLYRQVHRIAYARKNGDKVEVIAISNASSAECAINGVETSVVFLRLGN